MDRGGSRRDLVTRTRRTPADLDVAERPNDLYLPEYRAHRLSDDRVGRWSIRESANCYIVFRFEAPTPWTSS